MNPWVWLGTTTCWRVQRCKVSSSVSRNDTCHFFWHFNITGPLGSTEGINNIGTEISPVTTWDTKITTAATLVSHADLPCISITILTNNVMTRRWAASLTLSKSVWRLTVLTNDSTTLWTESGAACSSSRSMARICLICLLILLYLNLWPISPLAIKSCAADRHNKKLSWIFARADFVPLEIVIF